MYKVFKNLLDRLCALVVLLSISPLFILVSFLLCFHNRGAPFFKQTRPGKYEKLFTMYKFKTMRDTRNPAGELLPDKDRITSLGKVIRKLSFDELPQLCNVLKGDMSFVGPRPLLPEYLPRYNKEQQRRHDVKPGITGWAQVNGRNAISWQQKFEYDLWYIQKQSFILDIKILGLTFTKVFKTQDVNASSQTTMEAFNGDN